MPQPPTTRDLLREWYGYEIRTQPVENTYSIGTTATAIGKFANQRTAILIANLHATQTLYVGFSLSVSSTNGIAITSNNWLSFNWVNDNEIAARDLFAVGSGSSTTIYVLESVLAPVLS